MEAQVFDCCSKSIVGSNPLTDKDVNLFLCVGT
jgi:hypothetical protein